MACGSAYNPGTANTADCSAECFGGAKPESSGNTDLNYGDKGKGCNSQDGTIYACNNQAHGCPSNCTTDCASCWDNCSANCASDSSCSGCDTGCSGGCRGSCSGCRGSCSGGCEGSCEGDCNFGCTSEEQVNNSKVTLDRVINVDNVKNIFKFVISEVRRFGGKQSGDILNSQTATIPSIYNNIILSTTYIENGETKTCESYEKIITQEELPLTLEAYRGIYIDDNDNVQYGVKDDVNGLQYTTPKIFTIGQQHWATDLKDYYFNLNTNGNNVYRYKETNDELTLKVQEYRYTIEKINEYNKNELFLLYYTIPRLFENSFKTINESIPISSGTLIEENGEYYPVLEGLKTSSDWKYHADRMTAQEWIDRAKDLYDTVIPINDAR